MNFADLGISDKLITFPDGKQVVEYFDKLLNDIESLAENSEVS